jgi:hypothetical protein
MPMPLGRIGATSPPVMKFRVALPISLPLFPSMLELDI